MRPIVLLAALLVLLLPISTLGTVTRNIPATTSHQGPDQSIIPPSSIPGPTSLGQNLILKSVFGIAFFNNSGKIVTVQASLFMNMTLKMTNSTGRLYTITTANITIGPSPIVTLPVAQPLLFTLLFPNSGQAFLSNYGRLTIQAQMAEIFPCQLQNPPCLVPSPIYNLFLTGPVRLATTTSTISVFTSLFGFLSATSISPSPSKIGLFFLVGIAPGDLDEDGHVDIIDLANVALCYDTDNAQLSMTAATTSTSGYSNCYYADFDGDGRVDVQDLAFVAINFGHAY